jgi:phosphate transport system protein
MSDKHLSSQFDAALNLISTKLLEMGGLVESQMALVLELLNAFNASTFSQVLEGERQLDKLEVEIDDEVNNVIARRQPAARDLRLLMATSKCVTNLERAGDEARKIAKRLHRIHASGVVSAVNVVELRNSGEMALHILRSALDAFARMDIVAAAQIVRDDKAIDNKFRAFVRRLVLYLSNAPWAISNGLEYLAVAKAIERIGDHAKNIGEFVIYVDKGRDVRHLTLEQLEEEVLRG